MGGRADFLPRPAGNRGSEGSEGGPGSSGNYRRTILQIKIVAEKGDSDNGYVALDAIFMDDVHCSPFPEDASPNATATTPSPPTIRNCDFQEDFCDWSPMGEEFIWARSKGSQEDGTDGPSEDREGSKESETSRGVP